MKGRTKWFKTKDTYPVRVGEYECGVILSSMQKSMFIWRLQFDGNGFVCQFPMHVPVWRGLTKSAAKSKGEST